MKSPTYSIHVFRVGAGFNDRGDEGGKFGSGPAFIGGELGVDEVQPMKRVPGILDAAVHMHAACGAGVALDGRGRIDYLEFLLVSRHAELVTRYHRDHRE